MKPSSIPMIFLSIFLISHYLYLTSTLLLLLHSLVITIKISASVNYLLQLFLAFLEGAACLWSFFVTSSLKRYHDKIGQFLAKKLYGCDLVCALLLYASCHLLFSAVLFLARQEYNHNNHNNLFILFYFWFTKLPESKLFVFFSVMAMSALPTAVLSVAKLVATPSHASAVALLVMVHSLVNALLLLRDGASHLALGAALFPFIPAIATIVTIALEVCILVDTRVFPSQDMSIKQVSDCEKGQISIIEEVKI